MDEERLTEEEGMSEEQVNAMLGQINPEAAPPAISEDARRTPRPKSVKREPKRSEKGEREKAPKGPKEKKATISLDTPDGEVVRLNELGYALIFDEDVERFKDLPSEVFEALSAENRLRFSLAYASYKKNLEKVKSPELFTDSPITVSSRFATAQRRLEVLGKKPGRHYCWKRTDSLQQAARDGYVVSTDDDLVTFGNRVGRSHRVSAGGVTELVLHEIPEELHKEIDKRGSEKSLRNNAAVESTAKEELSKLGGKPFTEEQVDRRLNWS